MSLAALKRKYRLENHRLGQNRALFAACKRRKSRAGARRLLRVIVEQVPEDNVGVEYRRHYSFDISPCFVRSSLDRSSAQASRGFATG